MHSKLGKEVWDKLQNIYEGDNKVKRAKIRVYRGQFEGLKMEEDEKIAHYSLCILEMVNTIRGLGEIDKESSIVDKVLRTIPKIFNPKVSTLD